MGAPIAELWTLRNPVLSGALQLAAGILTAIVFLDLLPDAFRTLSLASVASAFCLSLGVGQAPLTFVATATAKNQGTPPAARRRLLLMYAGVI